jgi:hypothetical protein
VTKKSPVAEALKAKVKRTVRNPLEEGAAAQLTKAGIEFDYEELKVPYKVPERSANYVTDFVPRRTNIIIETKGHFGHGRDIKRRSAEERHKYLLVKEQHPELDIRFVFQRAAAKIYPGSPTTHAKWAEDHGFMWADKGVIPPAWLADILKQQQKGRKK